MSGEALLLTASPAGRDFIRLLGFRHRVPTCLCFLDAAMSPATHHLIYPLRHIIAYYVLFTLGPSRRLRMHFREGKKFLDSLVISIEWEAMMASSFRVISAFGSVTTLYSTAGTHCTHQHHTESVFCFLALGRCCQVLHCACWICFCVFSFLCLALHRYPQHDTLLFPVFVFEA
ncbi:hypothetical protein VTK56DRAFT_10070 [Thermocarpiscus australiensis]